MAEKCDVLVVGAGPAGSSAARAAAEGGLSTIFVDIKEEIKAHSSFAGAVGSYLIPYLPFKIPPEMFTWKIDEMQFNSHGITINRSGGPWTSYAIDRSDFDPWLVDNAVEAGAKLRLGTELVDLESTGDTVTKARLKGGNGEEIVKPKVVIGADGVNSTVLEKMGMRNENSIVGSGTSYEFENVELQAPYADLLFFGDFAPGGYAYVFPLARDRANIGVGSVVQGIDTKQRLQKFISLPEIECQIKNARKVNEKTGQVPFSYVSDSRVRGNVLLAGDAANQNLKPLIEGFFPAIICGSIAGKTAVQHLSGGAPLEQYEKNIERRLGPIFDESDRFIEVLGALSQTPDKEAYLLLMGLCANVFSIDDVETLKNEDFPALEQRLETWKSSRARQFRTNMSERLAILYLRLMASR